MANNNNAIDIFELPRLDWYDSKGRIYKDALIENFNAIEDKLLEIAGLDVLETEIPDFATLEYPDVTLDSDDTAIINLKSFLSITGLSTYPMELKFSGTKCTKLAWWGTDYKYHEVENVETSCSTSAPYIYFNPSATDGNYIYSSSSSTTPSDCQFVAFYTEGQVILPTSNIPMDINLLEGLANMKTRQVPYNTGDNNGDEDGNPIPYSTSGNQVGWFSYQEHNKTWQNLNMTAFGES